jgi:AraC family transcriptional regulator of adaptative response / DNA-3-methyladenine glycosylase II
VEPDTLVLRLPYRPPFDWDAMLSFLGARAIPGVEAVRDRAYLRTIHLGQGGWVVVTQDEPRAVLQVAVSASLLGALLPLRAGLSALFDLDAQPAAIAEQLGQDPRLLPLVRARPGLRVPGAFCGFETTVRAILGQQVSVRAATTLSGRLAEQGAPLPTPHQELTRLFPRPEALLSKGEGALRGIGLLAMRARALVALAEAVVHGGLALCRPTDIEAALVRLRALPGIGDWTAQYVAMRVLGFADAFPAGDLVLRRALGDLSAREAAARAEKWRPFSAYAAVHLWAGAASALNQGEP